MQNANLSTGPRSVEGKAVSRLNALKTGIYAKGETFLPTEKAQDLEALTAEYYERFSPATPEQRCLVDALISDEWLLRRFRTIEAQELNMQFQEMSDRNRKLPLLDAYNMTDNFLERLQRRINATRRNYRHTLVLLNQLQATPVPLPEPAQPKPIQVLTPAKQFVPSTPLPPVAPAILSPVSSNRDREGAAQLNGNSCPPLVLK